ncbi:MAG TPA: hypothetical protein HPQ00_16050 [Magnetococcales bacterium]|nr:hypothetical protein [Magnetococcales bacterium]
MATSSHASLLAGLHIMGIAVPPFWLSPILHPGHRLIIPHQELGIFLENCFGNLVRYGDNGGIVLPLPRLLKMILFGQIATALGANYFAAMQLN